MSNRKFFLSYSRSDAFFALKLVRDLRTRGVEIWIDTQDIIPGSKWDTAVEAALESSDSIVVILSTASVISNSVLDEVSFAIDKNKEVIPVLFSKCKVPLRLARIQQIDFTGDYQIGLGHLLAVLNKPLQQYKIYDNIKGKKVQQDSWDKSEMGKEQESSIMANLNKKFNGYIKKRKVKKLIIFIAVAIFIIVVMLNKCQIDSAIKEPLKNPPQTKTVDTLGQNQETNTLKYVCPPSKAKLEPIVYGANDINFDERGYVMVKNDIIMSDLDNSDPRSGGPANVLWDVSAPVSGKYCIDIYVNNPYSEPLKVYIIKDGVVTHASGFNPFSMLIVPPSSQNKYTWRNVPVLISLLVNRKTKIRLHAPRGMEETKHLPYIKNIRLILVDNK